MRFEGYDDELPDEEAAIDEALGDNPRARELRLMRAALESRLDVVRRERARTAAAGPRPDLEAKIAELKKQIAVLRQEEAITSFVEGSVRVALNRPSPDDAV